MQGEFALHQSELTKLIDAANEFASYPGLQNDDSAKEFLSRYPLPVMISCLQSEEDVPGLEISLVSCLERVFKTNYGASLIPHYMSFVQVGLQATSQPVRCLACKVISYLLENVGDAGTSVHLIIEYNLYPLLINCLTNGDELVAAASVDSIINLAKSPRGIEIIFPWNVEVDTHLKNLVFRCSSQARVRVFALIAKLFSISVDMASIVYNSNLLDLLVAEIQNTSDVLMTLSALELLYELAESPHGTQFLLRTSLLKLLTSVLRNTDADSILRSRAMIISGRLLTSATIRDTDNSDVKSIVLAIDARLSSLSDQDTDEYEIGLEALGRIGASTEGATLLFSTSSPIARHVVKAAFHHKGRGKQLAALHALGDIVGGNQTERKLSSDSEECLRQLIYATAADTSKLTPSGMFLSVLQQEPEARLAAYRVISGLVDRSWFLLEIFSSNKIINLITDVHIETNKRGMEARYDCCIAISKALSSSNLLNDPSVKETIAKLEEAIKRGPYLAKGRPEAQPIVVTAERF